MLKTPIHHLSHDPPPTSTVNANRIVRPNANAQTAAVVLAGSSPPPVSVAITAAVDDLALASLGLDDKPCGASAVVLLLHELELGTGSSLVASSHLAVAVASSHVDLAGAAGGLCGLGRRWWREQRVELGCLDGQ